MNPKRRQRYRILCVGFVISAALALRQIYSHDCVVIQRGTMLDSKIFLWHDKKKNTSYTYEELYSKMQTERERKWLSTINFSAKKHKRQRYPDVICIGMEKCGTEALISFLSNHPLIKTSPFGKELHFFSAHYNMQPAYYLHMMPYVSDEEIVMEKSASYFNLPPIEIPQRIKKLLPNVKIILTLCDPVNRIYSDFIHEREMKALDSSLTFDDVLERFLKINKGSVFDELDHVLPEDACRKLLSLVGRKYSNHIVTGGIYYYCLQYWLSIFPEQQIHIVNGEELLSNPGSVMSEVQEFIGIPELISTDDFAINEETGFHCFHPRFSPQLNWVLRGKLTGCLDESKGRTRMRNEKISDDSLKLVKDFYRSSNRKIFKLLGKNLGWQ